MNLDLYTLIGVEVQPKMTANSPSALKKAPKVRLAEILGSGQLPKLSDVWCSFELLES